MKAFIRTITVFAGLLFTAVGCGSSSNGEFVRELKQERDVAGIFAEHIRQQTNGDGPILVLVSPNLGPRLQKTQTERLQGLRSKLGADRVIPVDVAAEDDPRLYMVDNDYLPRDLLLETLSRHPDSAAVISLIGFPHNSSGAGLGVSLYLYGVTHQALAWQAMDSGWASAVLYSRGVDDQPPRRRADLSGEMLASYTLEVR